MSETSTLIPCTGKITPAELANVPTPPATATHIPIPHLAVVEGLVDILSRRQIGVVGEGFAVSRDGMPAFLKRRAQRDRGSTACPTSVGGNGLESRGPFPRRCRTTRWIN